MRAVLLFFIAILITSCQSKKDNQTYFGGAIINPLTSHILLCQKGEVLDSIAIDENGHFSHKFDLEKPGLFTFKHGYEFQVFYAEPQDSISLRLNTKEFDESLVFGGNNAHQNNFLIENFLKKEENNNLIYSYHKIPPKKFEQKIDSIRSERIEKLNQLENTYNVSDAYKEVALHSIDFEYFDMKERYSFLLNKFFPAKVKYLSPNYYDYRNEIDFGNEKIIELNYKYINYLEKVYEQVNDENLPHIIDAYRSNIKLIDNIPDEIGVFLFMFGITLIVNFILFLQLRNKTIATKNDS